MEHEILRLLLGQAFYDANKHRLTKKFFPAPLDILYDTIVKAHEKYERDLTIEEVRLLYRSQNPTLTRATVNSIEELLVDLETEDHTKVGPDAAGDIVEQMWRSEIGRQIAEYGIDLFEGRRSSLTDLQDLIARASNTFTPSQEFTPVTTDIDELVEQLAARPCWKFNIPSVAERCPGLAPGEFLNILARPEVGKTASYVSLACAPDGWCHQGADVHIICNEEPAIRTTIRAVSACTGMTRDQIIANREKAKALFLPIRPKLHIVDSVDMTVDDLDRYCATHKPDVLVVDQLDKLRVTKQFNRTDEALTEIYRLTREIAKRHGLGAVGICQASAEAEGKLHVTYTMAAGSKTGKPGEADLIIGIGKLPQGDGEVEDMTRTWFLSKNKITGWHGPVHTILNKALSRYTA